MKSSRSSPRPLGSGPRRAREAWGGLAAVASLVACGALPTPLGDGSGGRLDATVPAWEASPFGDAALATDAGACTVPVVDGGVNGAEAWLPDAGRAGFACLSRPLPRPSAAVRLTDPGCRAVEPGEAQVGTPVPGLYHLVPTATLACGPGGECGVETIVQAVRFDAAPDGGLRYEAASERFEFDVCAVDGISTWRSSERGDVVLDGAGIRFAPDCRDGHETEVRRGPVREFDRPPSPLPSGPFVWRCGDLFVSTSARGMWHFVRVQ